MSLSLRALVPPDWRAALGPVLTSPSFEALEAFLETEAKEANVFPPRHEIFRALKLTPLEQVKAVIIGQDPYPTQGNANGLAFSVSPGVKVPASLKNIFLGLKVDLGLEVSTSGDLTPWAERGVLLLNTVLTVREGAPNSHRKKGWEPVTQAVLRAVDARTKPVVFFCFGEPAKAMAKLLVRDPPHTVLAAPHPSPLNGKKFVEAIARDRLFSRANAVLAAAGEGPIDWAL